jgi:hypothetical protein
MLKFESTLERKSSRVFLLQGDGAAPTAAATVKP